MKIIIKVFCKLGDLLCHKFLTVLVLKLEWRVVVLSRPNTFHYNVNVKRVFCNCFEFP